MLSRRQVIGAFGSSFLVMCSHAATASTTRTLTVVRPQTGEVGRDIAFWRHGGLEPDALALLDWLLRDVAADEVASIDPRLYFGLHVLQDACDRRVIVVTSGYRTRATNERLRQRGIDAARNSFHLSGRAVDLRVEGVPLARLAILAERLGFGVGLYRSFVHLDTGPARRWFG